MALTVREARADVPAGDALFAPRVIGNIREGAVRHLRLTAKGITAHDAGALLGGVPGVGRVEVLESDGTVTLSATLEGAIQPLVKALGTLQLKDLVLEEPALEESVLQIYSIPRASKPEHSSPRETAKRAPRYRCSAGVFDSWRSTLAWAAGPAAATLLYLPLYPSIGGSAQMQDMIDALPAEMTRH
jgi:hypothetical protein